MHYHLMPVCESDKHSIQRVNDRCYRDVVTAQFGDWDEELQLEFFEKKWQSLGYQKIICNDQLSGVVASVDHDDHVFLSELLIDPDFQGKGLGTSVTLGILHDADGKGLPVRLQVLTKNRAKSMYERLGFSVTGETETHFLMERSYPTFK